VAGLIVTSLLTERGSDVLWINGLSNPLLDMIFYYGTSLGNGLVVIPLLITSLFIQFRCTVSVFLSFGFLGLIVSVLKNFVNMPRPASFLGEERLILIKDVVHHTQHSFPSGHTATAFCAATILSIWVNDKRLAMASSITALVVGLSRVYLAQHFLMDVAAGALIGVITGFLGSFLSHQMNLNGLSNRIGISGFSKKYDEPTIQAD
jgi:membrane-associated phospholipid phosphatase